jgi:hypothetical protein
VYTRTAKQMGLRAARAGRRIGRVARMVQHTEAGAALPATATVEQEIRRAQAIDRFHASLGWGGAGYSSMSCASGRVYEMRGAFRSGAHTVGLNSTALANCQAGHGDRTALTEAQIRGIRRWQGEMIRVGALTPNPTVTGHRNHAAKSCPGNRVYPQLPRLRGVTGPETTAPPTPAPDPAPTPTPPPPIEEDRMVIVQRPSDRTNWLISGSARAPVDRADSLAALLKVCGQESPIPVPDRFVASFTWRQPQA